MGCELNHGAVCSAQTIEMKFFVKEVVKERTSSHCPPKGDTCLSKFLIITQPRSGSAWFMSCLNSHPQIYCPRETTLFSKHNLSPIKSFKPNFLQVDSPNSPYYRYRSASFKRQLAHRFNKSKLISQFLDDIYTERCHGEVVGFKVNYSQIRKNKIIYEWIKRNNIKIIQLVRKNLLKRLVSHKVANKRRLFHSTQSVAPIKVHIDPQVLIGDFKRRQDRFNKYRKRISQELSVPYLEVTYESLLHNHESEIRKTLHFLGVDENFQLNSELVKVNPDSLKEIIENYSEVETLLKNTKFYKFL
jgi:LPS sulfotransferase NodH